MNANGSGFGKALWGMAVLFLCHMPPRAAAVVDTPYTVGTWQGFRSAALSMTFDDGLPNQYTTLLTLLTQYGYKVTYFVDMGNRRRFNIPWDDIRKAASLGHEIASHTVTHPHMGSLSVSEQEKELRDSKDTLERQIPTQKVLTMAYPFCDEGNNAAVAKYYLAARKCDKRFEPANPANFMGLSSFSWADDVPAASLNNNVETAIAKKAWTTYLIHGIDGGGGYTPVKSSMLKEHFDFLRTRERQIWIATFADVARYIRERQSLTLKQIRATKDSLVVKLTDTLPDAIYTVPVTLQRPLPDGWNTCFVTQNGRALKDTLVTLNSKRVVMFDAIPDGGDIVLSSSGVVAVPAPGGPGGKVTLSGAEGRLRISLPPGSAGTLELSVFDSRGVRRAVVQAKREGDGYHADLPEIGAGVYSPRLSLGGVPLGTAFSLRLR